MVMQNKCNTSSVHLEYYLDIIERASKMYNYIIIQFSMSIY